MGAFHFMSVLWGCKVGHCIKPLLSDDARDPLNRPITILLSPSLFKALSHLRDDTCTFVVCVVVLVGWVVCVFCFWAANLSHLRQWRYLCVPCACCGCALWSMMPPTIYPSPAYLPTGVSSSVTSFVTSDHLSRFASSLCCVCCGLNVLSGRLP